jgi:tetratricopeptide (TPR) repeat protein
VAEAPINIKLRCASWQQLSSIYKRDLSRHAIFLKSGSPPPIGTAVRIDLTLPTESMIVLTGAVSEHIPVGGLGGRGPGVDIRLNTIPQSALWLIETALASAQKQTAAAASPAAGNAAAPQTRNPDTSGPLGIPLGMEDGKDLASAEDELQKALTQELTSLRRLNPFQVLGVGYEASDEDVRGAFGELTRRYHPDRFTRYTSQELRALAAEIFILIRDAYRKLGDEPSRQKAVAAIGARPSVKVPTLRPERAATAPGTPPPAPPYAPTSRAGDPPAPMPAQAIPPRPDRTPPPPPQPALRPDRTPAPTLEKTPTPDRAPLPPTETQRRPMAIAPPAVSDDPKGDYSSAEALLDDGRYDEALALFKIYARKNPSDRQARAGIELAEGMRAIAQRDRLEAAQRFEAVLEIDPANERAARELAEMRRLATNERKGLLSRLMGKKE